MFRSGKKATEEEERGRKEKILERKKLYVEHFSTVFRRRLRSVCLSMRICLGERYAIFSSTRCSFFSYCYALLKTSTFGE